MTIMSRFVPGRYSGISPVKHARTLTETDPSLAAQDRTGQGAGMDVSMALLNLAGSVALLLWGVHMVQTGIQRALGARLNIFLTRALRNRFKAFLAGMGVTAILQSSTATGLMLTGFAAGGLVELAPALAVMLGANVGSTLIVQLLSFDIAAVAPVMILIGVMMFRRGQAATRDTGRIMIGLGLMLMALHSFVALLEPYEHAGQARELLGVVASWPLLDLLLGAGLTWAAHSSVATVLLMMSFAQKGAISPDAAFAMVLGANIGTAINPVLEGASGEDPAARRLPLGNLLLRTLGAVVAMVVLGPVGRLMVQIEPDAGRAVADFHTAFNLMLAIVAFPLLDAFANMLKRMLPARQDEDDPARPLYLDGAAVESPPAALGGAAREALRLVDVLETMLHGLKEAFARGGRKGIADTRRLDSVLDRLNAAIRSYLTRIDPEAMSEADHRRVREILSFGTNIENAGDVIERNLLSQAMKKFKGGIAFSPEADAEIQTLIERCTSNLRNAAALFMTEDVRLARRLAAEKEVFRDAENSATEQYFRRLRTEGKAAELENLYLDVLRDLKLMNTHLVAAAAYPVLEAHGELAASRLRVE
ncbi:Sodium-dependent phosphate transporter [Granulibacter bethesdensis CGDNIH1]|uniref:Sodium-dependent phosphate transporter n=2 Tax=Granulibacter bethesdensis TaxID=364410 RepID=Q0BUY2_GRABC|nr:Sodium-dependent phosphate transporter [Granulibacter bethesdensis CGDNIH1]APH51161.1 Sodium-dependent phosphate transporter [Granulibacter bethesdensis]APH63855.1 Sodium-dependent phosphate transporter [Granulibacter bethesdensis]